ncbi:hypothetical protein HYY69_01345 [Candidatus Woesearchaeota archaeon]|nr:hypothetical protein [Candidatus Woesearchaeota archaeon]
MAKRGRPIFSPIRQNLIEILFFLGKGYGYELHKIYNSLFPKCTNRVVYYHLRKGVSLEEFKLEKVKVEHGNYSWGSTAEKSYYSLGKSAQPKQDQRIKEWLDKNRQNKSE